MLFVIVFAMGDVSLLIAHIALSTCYPSFSAGLDIRKLSHPRTRNVFHI